MTTALRITTHDVPGERLMLIAWDHEGREAFRVPLPASQALDLAAGLIAGARLRIPREGAIS
jgi:hypothetical protein